MKKTVIVIIVILLLLGGGYAAYRYFGSEEAAGSCYVQSVAEITGMGAVGLNNRYMGIVEAKETIEITPDETLTIKECYVSAGDAVMTGDPLFAYDVDAITLNYEQLLIDISGLENKMATDKREMARLEKKIAKAKESKVYALQLDYDKAQLDYKKSEYDAGVKRRQAAELKVAIDQSTVTSPVDGKIRSVRSGNSAAEVLGYTDNENNAYLTIVAGHDYRIKGTVSEQTVYSLSTGMSMRIISRTDGAVTAGEISEINTSEPVKSGNVYYSEGDGQEKASKYAFYVTPESAEGLMIGQHVYLEFGSAGEEKSGLQLPAYYLTEEDGSTFVFAVDAGGKLEKRLIRCSSVDENTGCVTVTEGLTGKDYIAFPDENVAPGMTAVYSQAQEEPEA